MKHAAPASPAAIGGLCPKVLLVVLALHGMALAALLAATAIRERITAASPVEVAVIEQSRPRAEPPPPLPFRPRLPQPLPVSIAAPEITIAMPRVAPIAAPAPDPAPAITAVPAQPLKVAVAAPPAAAVEPPRFDLAYLRNPAPAYPLASKRVREEGRVVLRVRVTPAGLAESVEIRTSSGFERLDQAAIDAVKRWRFSPARRGAEAVTAYALVPILFSLDS